MATRAIHLELASNLSTDAMIVALRNFIFRRGQVSDIYSDNGTNFVGANKELKAEWLQISQNMAEKATKFEITWHFNPPSAPNFGGAWERLVRSVKQCLEALLKSSFPREDTLRSALIEAEFIVNSRPLTHVSIEDEDEEALTPNHFLIGCSGNVPTIMQFDLNNECGRKQWKIASQISNSFWRKWIRSYLPEISRRTKWYENVDPIKIGDIGVLIDENALRNTWRKAKVIAVHPGKDGVVRTLTLKTATGELKRPASKFAKLDVIRSS
jgi:hypothetical protein